MFLKKHRPEPKRVDPLAIMRTNIDEAIRNACDGYRSMNWPTYLEIARSLEDFAQQVRSHVAMHRPIV